MNLILQLANIGFSAWKIAQFQYGLLASENLGPGIKLQLVFVH